MRKAKANKSIQTGRNLPTRFSSYSPRHTDKLASQMPQVDEIPSQSQWRRVLARAIVILLLLLLAVFLFIGIWDARNISAASQKMFGTGNILSLINSSGLQADSNGRINMVIAGYSLDDPGHSGAKLTDSIILLSMSSSAHSGYILSIPRDLYVKIPGYGYGKINEVYSDGGMPLLQQVVSTDFGMPVPYYALLDYAATRSIVDSLGGIDVTINSPDGRLYDPNRDYSAHGPLVDLSNGPHHLNGEQALDLSRARGEPSPYGEAIGFNDQNGGSDFQRTADQRLIFSAIKSKLNWKLILNPRQNGQILNAIADNVKINIKAGEARTMFGLFNSIPNNRLQSLSLRDLGGKNYLVSTYYEGSTLSPAAGLNDYSDIQSALEQYN